MASRRSSSSTPAANKTARPRKPLDQRVRETKAQLAKLEAEQAAQSAKESGSPELAQAIVAFEKVAPHLSAELAIKCRAELRQGATQTSLPSLDASDLAPE